MASSKILPFGISLGGVPGPVGVNLGLRLPIPASFTPLHHNQGSGITELPGASRPTCAGRSTYCPHSINYPRDKVNSIIDRFYNDVSIIYNDLYTIPSRDVLYYDNATLHFRQSGHFVCDSTVEFVRPGWAQNLRGEWVAILNTDKFPQTVRVETCRYAGKRCEYLPPCYKSQCVQRYSYARLLSLSPYHPTYRPLVDVFQIPSACSCFVEDFTYY